MIIDSLSVSSLYDTANPLLSRAFSYIKSIDLATIADGRYEIDGDRIYMMIMDNKALKTKSEAALEVHDKYIDIQIVIRGSESFGWKQRALCKSARGSMDREKDILFFDDTPSTYFTLGEGEFAIFMPEDAHAPLVGEGVVKKCVIKVMEKI